MFEADPSKEKKKAKEGENVVEEPAADIPSLLELKQIYYQLMIRYIWLCFKCGLIKLLSLELMNATPFLVPRIQHIHWEQGTKP